MRIDGKCHCGNVTYALDWPEDAASIPARACVCTFCRKHGGVWTSRPGAALNVTVRDRTALSDYAFGTGTATFHVCARCGVVPFVSSRIDDRLYAVVNVNTFEGIDPSRIHTQGSDFDGEAIDSRLARRTRNWIDSVHIETAA